MLILKRTRGRSVFIDNDYMITLVEIRSDGAIINIERRTTNEKQQAVFVPYNEQFDIDKSRDIFMVLSWYPSSALSVVFKFNAPRDVAIIRDNIKKPYRTRSFGHHGMRA